MISINNFKNILMYLGYEQINKFKYKKNFTNVNCNIIVDFEKEKIIYPEEKGFKITRSTTCNFSDKENFVVLECVTRLFDKGYRPEHIELEPLWSLGHSKKSGFADILVKGVNGNTLFIVECKTAGKEYKKEYKNILNDGGQLFSYWQQEKNCKWLVLYASDFVNGAVEYFTDSINCSDDENIKNIAKKDDDIKIYEKATTVEELFEVWCETYEGKFSGDVVFRDDSVAYQIGVKPLRKKDLLDFAENNKVVNKFEEILRHNNVSDKENAFNRLIALFICKLVDEIKKEDEMEVDFQYKIGTDTFESLQDRLQRLHKEGMKDFMDEEIFYVPDDYADKLVQGYTGHKRKRMIEDLKENLRKLKFYTNNDFAFKDVHNEELFYQNGKILVEVVQLFEKYRIAESNYLQMLGDLFEQLLNKGFKQNEGQFFTPIPITKFIWKSIPLSKIIEKESGMEYPKIIDFACGAGHFLTQGYDTINAFLDNKNIDKIIDWEQDKLYGIEKDYRLARVSKISLFMHGAGKGNIKFGDGLENYKELNIKDNNFDILVANPPYSVSSFKPYLKLKDNKFEVLKYISNNGSEIETLFVERMMQLLKPCGIAAVILPSTILNKTNESFIKARELILENFKIRCIASFGSKTFGATGTNTVILFLEKFDYPPKKTDSIEDIVDSIFENRDLKSWIDDDIIEAYINKINVSKEDFIRFINKEINYIEWENNEYFNRYLQSFSNNTNVKNKKTKSSFKKMSELDKIKFLNSYFYNLVHKIEKEKLRYFSLAFRQDTLIVQAPDDNKEQEKFLGYKWSNRKGQEGIQILKYGGMLFNGNEIDTDNTISDVVKNSFCDNRVYNDKEEYYYYLKLTDMIDFNSIDFYKTINTNRIRIKNLKPGYKAYRLGDEDFELSIGSRVVEGDSLIKENGKYPIYSANVFEEMGRTDHNINKKGLTNFDIPSVIWGIDGDWMVNYIEENKPFYPTDHCGVLRVKNKNILPKYLRYALDVEGKFERFSRHNRASTGRVSSIVVHIPEKLSEQKSIVSEINAISKAILDKEKEVNHLDEKVKSKFVKMFDLQDISITGKTNKYQMKPISQICYDYRGVVMSSLFISEHKGTYPVYSSQTTNNGIFGYIDTYDFDGEYITWTTDGVNAGTVFYRNGKFNCTNVCGILKAKNNSINMIYLSKVLGMITHLYVNHVGNDKLMNTAMKNILVPIPPKSLQDEFADFVKEQDKLKFSIKDEIERLKDEKQKKISEYFE